ncbi:hypothetical protein [Bosea vestrisii]|uniref:Uncharacterized protein n=1 Tax=Bosea vestrisii TaxID=151416 RepID=A0ABW0HA81_9HYPH
MKVYAAVLTMCLSAGWSTARAELTDLNDFIDGIEKADSDSACQVSEPMSALWKELRLRYVPSVNEKPSEKVSIPARFSAAFGKANIKKRDSEGYRHVIIPLIGVYRGLITNRINFYIGIENGISIISISFKDSKKKVERILGPDLARRTSMSQGYAEIIGRGAGSELVCDLST